MKPIKCLVYKPACEFWNELLNFATNFRTSQRSSESYNEKLPEIDCNVKSISTITISPVVQKKEENPKDETGNASLTAKQQLIKLVM